ncbi:hypothetical protein MS3_00001266 [Schistosoma haematobium]|uniref:PHD-type domain-containing protein n=1 Tax=Schistosoma haematobium TaxID=6185 RepID=A0A922S3T8_SCHHA|nr:hypothetical protein MS3_00001266 [Schistosoma haematobium]KAH9592473.1 hypothetical protein MS3_00001266 [Schistosoma haematobium]
MVGKTHKCWQPNCLFPVEEGMQCDDCKKWYHKMCTRLSPTAYKRCSKPNSHWLCMFCCTDKKVLIREAMALLALACKKNDGGSNDNKSTDGEECVSVVSAATGPVKHLTVIDGNVKSPLTLTRNEVPLDIDIGSHTPLAEIEDPDKTVTVPRSPGVAVLTGDKWTSVRRKRNGKKKTVGKTQLVSKALEGMLSEEKSSLRDKTDLSERSVIFHKIRESSDKEPKARFEHDLNHIKTSLSKLLPDTVSGVSICKLCRIGKKVDSKSPPKNRLLKVTFNTVEERNLILSNSRKLIGSGIYVREDLSLADRIKRRAAEAEINERCQNGERNLVLKGFQVVKVRSKTIPKPLWVARKSSPQT